MNKQIKAMPWSVKLAIIFLLICYITLLFLVPVASLIITFFIGVGAAINRILVYIINED